MLIEPRMDSAATYSRPTLWLAMRRAVSTAALSCRSKVRTSISVTVAGSWALIMYTAYHTHSMHGQACGHCHPGHAQHSTSPMVQMTPSAHIRPSLQGIRYCLGIR